MVKNLVLILLMMLTSTMMWAQKKVTGKVCDTSGQPLPGVYVVEVGGAGRAVTNTEGIYTIEVGKSAATINFTFVGMEPKKVSTAGKTQLNITMQEAVNELAGAEVVSTGYQKISRERSTASYGFVDSLTLSRTMNKDVLSALEGQVAGLHMSKNPNNGANSPIIRGVGTFSSEVGTEPLIVIDDIPTAMKLDEINPYNVESITVLKDAAAASIYGALAANGVIVITTKQAKQAGKARVTVNADWFISEKPSLSSMHYASSSDIIDYETAAYNARVANSGDAATMFSSLGNNYYSPLYQLYRDREEGRISQSDVDKTLARWRNNDYYNEFRDEMWRAQVTQRYNVALSQSSGKSNHYASFKYEHENGRMRTESSDAFALYYKSNFDLTRWLSIKMGIDARLHNSTSPNGDYTKYTLQERYSQIRNEDGTPYYAPYVNAGGFVGGSTNGSVVAGAEGISGLKPFSFNILESIYESQTEGKRVNLRPFVNAEVRFCDFLKMNVLYQYEWSHTKQEQYDDANTYQMRLTHNAFITPGGKCLLPDGGRYMQQQNTSQRYTVRGQLAFDKSWKQSEHIVNAIVGMELRENKSPRMVQQLMYGYNDVALTSSRMDWQSLYTDGWESAVYDQTMKYQGLPTSQSLTRHRYASFYMNAGYTMFHKYSLTGSLRWDETDLFGVDTREQHHPMWSIGASWNISQEKFMEPISWLDYLKLRMTYGVNGNVDQSSSTYFVARYRTLSSDPTATPYLNYSDDNLPNPQLRWERTATFNLGVDFRVLNGVLSGSLEYYNRTGSDLLVRKYLDSTLGATQRVINNGKIRNQGLELQLRANILRKRDWDVYANFTFALNENKMLSVEHSSTDVAQNFITAPQNYFIEGTSYNTLWAYRLSRVVNGYPVILDADGKEMAEFDAQGNPVNVQNTSTLKGTDALVNCGSIAPKFNGSLALGFRWKSLEMNALFVFAGGNKLRLDVTDLNTYASTSETINDRWSAQNPNGVRMFLDMPTDIQQYAGTFNDWWRYSDRQVVSANYFKLRNINIAYTLPKRWTDAIGFGATKLTAQISNLFYISAAGRDIDPESYSLNSGTRTLHQPRTYSIGFSTSF